MEKYVTAELIYNEKGKYDCRVSGVTLSEKTKQVIKEGVSELNLALSRCESGCRGELYALYFRIAAVLVVFTALAHCLAVSACSSSLVLPITVSATIACFIIIISACLVNFFRKRKEFVAKFDQQFSIVQLELTLAIREDLKEFIARQS